MRCYTLLSVALLASAAFAQTNVESRAYFATNPNGSVGKNAAITIDGSFSDWNESMLIAMNGANNVATAFKGSHENNVLDIYALFGAWDDQNLYFAWQMCNTGDVWAREGDGPLTDYGKVGDVPLILALSIDPSKPGMTGLLEDGRAIWCDTKGNGTTFDPSAVHVDHLLFMSAKVGQGDPAIFKAVNAKGESNYTNGKGFVTFKAAGVEYAKSDGFMLSELWRSRAYAEWYTPTELKSDPSVLLEIYDKASYDNLLAGPIDGLKPHDTKYDTFFEIKIPLKALGINREWLEANGIGARIIATRGESALDCCPHDPSMVDNVFAEYGKDNSTTHEKDDLDLITYAMADVAKVRDLQHIDPTPDPDPDPDPNPDPDPDPTPDDGNYTVYLLDGNYAPQPYAYVWDKGDGEKQYAGVWPGTQMTSTTINGEKLWKYSFSSDKALISPMVIFNNGSGSQTDDLEFVNNGIYDGTKYTGRIVDNISGVNVVEVAEGEVLYFDLQGVRLSNIPESGIYIRVANGKAVKVLR